MNRVTPSLVAATMLVVLLLPLVSVAADTGRTNQAYMLRYQPTQNQLIIWTDRSTYNVGETVTIFLSQSVAFGAGFWVVIIAPDGSQQKVDFPFGQDRITVQAHPPTGVYEVELWGQVVAPDARPEYQMSCYFEVVGGPAPSNDVKFRGTVVSVSPDQIDYDVRIEEILVDPSGTLRVGTVVLVDVWDSSLIIGGPIAVGDKVELYGEPVVHVRESDHYIKKIGGPSPICGESAVRNVVMCPDGVNWKQREVCRNNNWIPESQACPECREGDVRVLETCPDGSWSHRQVCRNNVWVDEYQQCPECSEGAVRNVVMCQDGVNWKQREVCRNNNWVPESQPCPECSEGAENVLEWCPDGRWSHKQVCRNNAWQDEYQNCPSCPDGQYWDGSRCVCPSGQEWNGQQCVTPRPHEVFSLEILVFPQELGLTIHGSGDYPAGETVTLQAPSQAGDMYLLGWWLDGVPKTLTQEFTMKMDAAHQTAAVYVKPSAYKSIVTSIKKQLVDNIEDVSKEIVEKAKQLGPDEHIIDITIDLDLTAMGAIEDYAGWALFAKDSNYFAGKLSTLISYAFDVTQLGIDASKCAQKDNCDIDKIKEDLLDFAETNFVVGADLLLAYAVCAVVLGVPTAGAGAILCPVATSLVILAVQQVKIGDKNIFEHLRDGVDKLTDWIAKGICKLVGWILRRTVCTIAGSDVKLLVVDPKGLRTGATLENGQWVMYGEISSSWYGGLESHPQYVVISDPELGNYQLVVTSKGDGSYELQVTSTVDGSVVATQQYHSDIRQGETEEYSSQLMSNGNMIVTPPATLWNQYWPFVLGGAIVVGSAGTFLALRRNRGRTGRPRRSGRPRVKEIRSTTGKPRVKSIQEAGTKPRVLKVEEE